MGYQRLGVPCESSWSPPWCSRCRCPLAPSPSPSPPGPDTYLQFHLGALLPQGDLDDLDTGYTVGGSFGARFTRHLAVEAGVAYERATHGGAIDTALMDVPISVSLVARLPFKRAELAAYGGGDLHLLRLTVDTVGLPERGSNDVAFGGHVGARAAFNVWPTTLVGFDVRGTFAEATFGGDSTRIDGIRLAVTLQYRF